MSIVVYSYTKTMSTANTLLATQDQDQKGTAITLTGKNGSGSKKAQQSLYWQNRIRIKKGTANTLLAKQDQDQKGTANTLLVKQDQDQKVQQTLCW